MIDITNDLIESKKYTELKDGDTVDPSRLYGKSGVSLFSGGVEVFTFLSVVSGQPSVILGGPSGALFGVEFTSDESAPFGLISETLTNQTVLFRNEHGGESLLTAIMVHSGDDDDMGDYELDEDD